MMRLIMIILLACLALAAPASAGTSPPLDAAGPVTPAGNGAAPAAAPLDAAGPTTPAGNGGVVASMPPLDPDGPATPAGNGGQKPVRAQGDCPQPGGSLGNRWSTALCQALVANWFNYQYYYHLGQYLDASWSFHHWNWECWHNAGWTNPSLKMRCLETTYWTYGAYHHFLATQFNAFEDYKASQPPSNCSNYPYPTGAYAPNPGHQTYHWLNLAPPYDCYSLARYNVPEETGSW